MTNKTNTIISLSLIALLSACSTTYDASEQLKEQYEAQKLLEELKAEKAAREAEKKQAQLEELPDWYLNPPKNDGFGVYGVGAGESDSYALAIKKAKLQAEFSAAEQMKATLSGLVKSYQSEQGNNTTQSFSETIEKLVANAPIAGYTVVKNKVMTLGSKYHSYYLIHLPYSEFNKALQQNNSETASPEIKEAFKELERKVKESKQASKSLDKTPVSDKQVANNNSTLEDKDTATPETTKTISKAEAITSLLATTPVGV